MLFNSLEFLVFFTVVVAAYFAIPHRFRWVLLLIASYWFYMSAKVEYGILLLVSTVLGYFGSLWIERTDDEKLRKKILVSSIVMNILMLVAFKYANFITENMRSILGSAGLDFSPFMLHLILPLGISFYTLQVVSYLIDVYNKRISAERHFGIYAVYHAFFPQLVAGPIERGGHLIPQFRETHYFSESNVTEGVRLMLWGFFKKVVVADRLALVVNTIYGNPFDYTGTALLLAIVFFTFQIYCDFSGYTDIARGVAKVMGFELVMNFNRPFFAKNMADFWRRWHISLSSWFQDYIFNPLYLFISRWGIFKHMSARMKHAFSFLVAMVIGESLLGLWHGANWTFVLFGLYHGFFILLYYFTRKWWDKTPNSIQIGVTFLAVSASFVFFRAENLSQVWYVFLNAFKGLSFSVNGTFIGMGWDNLIVALFCIVSIVCLEMFEEKNIRFQTITKITPSTVWVFYGLFAAMIIIFGMFQQMPFIYFQF